MGGFESQSIELKSKEEVSSLRSSGRLAAQLLSMVCDNVQEGVSTQDLDALAARWIKEHNAKPAFLNYRGFPKTICISVNDEIVHGIPSSRKIPNWFLWSADRYRLGSTRTF